MTKSIIDEQSKEHTHLVEFEILLRGSKRVPWEDQTFPLRLEHAIREMDGVESAMTVLEKYYV